MRPFMTVLVLTVSAAVLPAQTLSYPGFSPPTGLTISGDASTIGTVMRLTSASLGQRGAVFADVPQPVIAGFDTTFSFRVSGEWINGDEGFTFVVHTDPAGSTALGTTGAGMGYANITGALVVEFDTALTLHPDGTSDLSDSEVSVHYNGGGAVGATENHAVGSVAVMPSFADGGFHMGRIRYAPGTLEVYVDDLLNPVLSVPFDIVGGVTLANATMLPGLTLLNGSDAWVGFTAGTGPDPENHDLLSWSWQSTLLDPCLTGNVGGASQDAVLTINNSTGGFLQEVAVATFEPISLEMGLPPTAGVPAVPFILFGTVGSPVPWTSPVGELCLTPAIVASDPSRFVVIDSFGLPGSGALVPPSTAPWSLPVPSGVGTTGEILFQGAIQDGPTVADLAVTNGVTLRTYIGPAPSITGVSPAAAAAGATVQISGSGFSTSATVTLGGVGVTPTAITSTLIDVTVPAGVACDSQAVVTNPDGQSDSVTWNPSPVITGTVSSTGPAAGGTTFVIQGSFVPGCTVTIGGAAATPVVNTSTIVVVVLTPPGSTGTASVVVTTPTGCTATTTYTYL